MVLILNMKAACVFLYVFNAVHALLFISVKLQSNQISLFSLSKYFVFDKCYNVWVYCVGPVGAIVDKKYVPNQYPCICKLVDMRPLLFGAPGV